MATYGWGRTDSGALPGAIPARPDDQAITSPQQLTGLEGVDVTTAAAGDAHSVFVSNHGDVFTCGRGAEGQLGRPGDARTVLRVGGPLEGERVVKVAAGAGFTLAVTEDGRLYEWGLVFQDANAKPGDAPARGSEAFAKWTPTAVAAAPEASELAPVKDAFSDPSLPGQGSTAAKLAASRDAMDPLAIARAAGIDEQRAWEIAGTVLPGMAQDLSQLGERQRRVVIRSALRFLAASGSAALGQDGGGEGTASDRRTATRSFDADVISSGILRMKLERVPVPAPRPLGYLEAMGVKVKSVAAGHAHIVLVDTEGHAYSAGFNDGGQLGLGHRISVPTFQPIVRAMAAIDDEMIDAVNRSKSAGVDGAAASAASTDDGAVYCRPETGFAGAVMTRPRPLSAHSHCAAPLFSEVACGQAHTLLLDQEGRVWGCGGGGLGQLGNDSGGDRLVPSLVVALPVTHPDAVDATTTAELATMRETFVLDAASSGSMSVRQHILALGSMLLSHAISARTHAKVVSLACGNNHSLLLTSDGALFGMGHAEYGQFSLGPYAGLDGDLAMPPRYYYRPRLIGASIADPLSTQLHQHRITDISAGSQFSACRSAAGAVVTFGWNSYGVLGSMEESNSAASTASHGGSTGRHRGPVIPALRGDSTSSTSTPASTSGATSSVPAASVSSDSSSSAVSKPLPMFGESRPALNVVCGRDHMICLCLPDGDPAAQSWRSLTNPISSTPHRHGDTEAADGLDGAELQLQSRWDDSGAVSKAAEAAADVLVVGLESPPIRSRIKHATEASTDTTPAKAATKLTAAQQRASDHAAGVHVDRKAVVSKLEGLLGKLVPKTQGVTKTVGTATPATGAAADVSVSDRTVVLPDGAVACVTRRRGSMLAHWPVLQSRFHALRDVSDTEELTELTAKGLRVVIVLAASSLGVQLLKASGVKPVTPPRIVVAVLGVNALSTMDAVMYAYSDRMQTPKHRARQMRSLAKLLGAPALVARASMMLRESSQLRDKSCSSSDEETETANATATAAAAATSGEDETARTKHSRNSTDWQTDMTWLVEHGQAHGDVSISADADIHDDTATATATATATGDDRSALSEIVRAHRVALLRCDFFRVALEGEFRGASGDVDELALPGVSASILRLVIDWLHRADSRIITGETVLPLMEVARRICIDDLLREAEAAAMAAVDEESAAAVLDVAVALDLPRLANAARKVATGAVVGGDE